MSTFSSWHEVSAPEQNHLGVDTYTFTAGYQNLSSATMNREFGLLNLMNTPEHCSAPFHSVSSKVAKSTKMAAAHIQTYVLHVTWSILYTYLIKNSYHFNIFLCDMCVDTVMHHHSIKVAFGMLESAGVQFYRDVGFGRCNSLRIGHDHSME